LGRRAAAFLTVFVTVFFAGLTAALRTIAFLFEVFAAFFEALFFLVAVVFATSHLLKLRRGGYGRQRDVYSSVSAWRIGGAANATNCRQALNQRRIMSCAFAGRGSNLFHLAFER